MAFFKTVLMSVLFAVCAFAVSQRSSAEESRTSHGYTTIPFDDHRFRSGVNDTQSWYERVLEQRAHRHADKTPLPLLWKNQIQLNVCPVSFCDRVSFLAVQNPYGLIKLVVIHEHEGRDRKDTFGSLKELGDPLFWIKVGPGIRFIFIF